MPTYDYMCDYCNIVFEVQHKMSETPSIVCPQCGQASHQVLSAGFGLNFTGKGFYQTDTRKAAVSGGTAAKEDKVQQSSSKSDNSTHTCTKTCGCSGKCSGSN